jgi:hypothetical protein
MDITSYEVFIFTPDGACPHALASLEKEIDSLPDVLEVYPIFKPGKVQHISDTNYYDCIDKNDENVWTDDVFNIMDHFISRQDKVTVHKMLENWDKLKLFLERKMLLEG